MAAIPKREVFWRASPVPASNVEARSSFPAVHERAELARLWKPHESMDMVGHDHEATADAVLPSQLIGKDGYDDLAVARVIQKSAASRCRT